MSDLLGAVNRCLRAIGEAPVNSTTSGHPDVGDALLIINDVTREVLMAGWHHNTSERVVLSPNLTGRIVVPANTLRVDSMDGSAHVNVVVREYTGDGRMCLFNLNDNTFTFDTPITARTVTYFEFDGNPYHIREYISARSARVFQETSMGSVSLDNFTTRAEADAWTKLVDTELSNQDNNTLKDSAYMRTITGRNNDLRWR